MTEARGGSFYGPPRVLSSGRPSPLRAAACTAALLALGLLACAGSPRPHRALRGLWDDYQALPSERAFAVAGSLRQERWVAGMSGGHGTRVEAETGALRECQRRRHAQRMTDACRLYAVGDEIVDGGR